jgi:hypothetical protein
VKLILLVALKAANGLYVFSVEVQILLRRIALLESGVLGFDLEAHLQPVKNVLKVAWSPLVKQTEFRSGHYHPTT